MGCACSAVGAKLWRGGISDVLQGECGIGGWGEIGEDTREPLEGRIQQDSINNLVFVPVKYEGKAAWTIELESL